MAYVPQTVSVNQILTAAIYNQTEVNIRDHEHGVAGVLALTATMDAVAVLNRVTADTDVVNTAVETNFYSFSVPANTLGTNRAIMLIALGDYLQNGGGARDITLRAKWSGQEYFSLAFNGVPAGASRRGWRIITVIMAHGATNDQIGDTVYQDHGAGSALGTANLNTSYANAHDTLAVDSTVAQTLVLTAQHSLADAAMSFRLRTARLVVLR